jgi:uncharacterized membrane protein
VETTRLETFSDGVFAIAVTLLILEVRVDRSGSLAHDLVAAWPSYLAYVISFLTIGIIWVNHHTVFGQIGRVDRTFLFVNVLFLMAVAFIPFPTSLIAEHLGEEEATPAAFTYGLTLTVTAVCFSALWFYAVRAKLLRSDADPATVAGISRSYLPGAPLYLTATLLALVLPNLSVAMYAGIALFYVVESSIFGRKVVEGGRS